MNPAGTTRTSVRSNHAFIGPDSHVTAAIAGWDGCKGVVLVSPAMGARFQQYVVTTEPGSTSRGTGAAGVERFVFVMGGAVRLEAGGKSHDLGEGAFAAIPADFPHVISTVTPGKVMAFEKKYAAVAGGKPPGLVVGNERDVAGAPFLGDPDAVLKVLLPDDPAFDWAVNIFTYKPGATLPFVEVHVMEHGLLFLQGQGVYRLDDRWYPCQAGDAIWMGPYCPQWFVASGKTASRYIYYKDVNRDALEGA